MSLVYCKEFPCVFGLLQRVSLSLIFFIANSFSVCLVCIASSFIVLFLFIARSLMYLILIARSFSVSRLLLSVTVSLGFVYRREFQCKFVLIIAQSSRVSWNYFIHFYIIICPTKNLFFYDGSYILKICFCEIH